MTCCFPRRCFSERSRSSCDSAPSWTPAAICTRLAPGAVLLGCYEDVRIAGGQIAATLRLCATPPADWVKSLLQRQESEAVPLRSLFSFSIAVDSGVLAEVEPSNEGCQVIQRILDVRRTLVAVHRVSDGVVLPNVADEAAARSMIAPVPPVR